MNKNLLTRVIIISDDLYYLQGLSAKLGHHYRFFIECFFCSQNACNNDLSTLRFDNRFTKNVLLVAVDDVSILANCRFGQVFNDCFTKKDEKQKYLLFTFRANIH